VQRWRGYSMTELEKLKHLLEHWLEHNEAHIRTYNDWAYKADSLGKREVAEILKEVVEKSKKLDELFRRALNSI